MSIVLLSQRIQLPAMTVYKVVTPYRESQYAPEARTNVASFFTKGVVLNYERGRLVVSPSGPGIMAFLFDEHARAIQGFHHLIELYIPQDTFGYYGMTDDERHPIVCVERAEVLT